MIREYINENTTIEIIMTSWIFDNIQKLFTYNSVYYEYETFDISNSIDIWIDVPAG